MKNYEYEDLFFKTMGVLLVLFFAISLVFVTIAGFQILTEDSSDQCNEVTLFNE